MGRRLAKESLPNDGEGGVAGAEPCFRAKTIWTAFGILVLLLVGGGWPVLYSATVSKNLSSMLDEMATTMRVHEGLLPRQAAPLSLPQHIKWSYDEEWFQSQRDLGCCQPAKQIYGRYAKINHRCCTDRLDDIVPLRPVGGMGWYEWYKHYHANNNNEGSDEDMHENTTIQFVGDSIGEQHLISLLCLAWATEGLTVSPPTFSHNQTELGPLNGAHIKGASWKTTISPLQVTLSFTRAPRPELYEFVEYTSSDVLIVGGWHMGGTTRPNLDTFFQNLHRLRPNKLTLVSQALPNHFPGGKYQNSLIYPNATTSIGDGLSVDDPLRSDVDETLRVVSNFERARHSNGSLVRVCETTSVFPSDPNINHHLDDLLLLGEEQNNSSSTSFEILRFADMYTHRGDANIGLIQADTLALKKGRIDCLHWCVAPGVLDALARETLLVLALGESLDRSAI